MKSRVKLVLQRILGVDTYLTLFAVWRVLVFRLDPREKGLLYLVKLLPPNPLVIDIGANIGVTATILKQEMPSAKVVAFEPVPLNLRALRRLFTLFHVDAEVQPVAVGDSAGRVEMLLPNEKGVVLHGLSHLKRPDIGIEDKGATYAVEMIKLDDACHLWGNQRISAIKLDVENSEWLVLQGAKRLLQKDQPVIYCELWDTENRSRCFNLAHDLGYSINVLAGGKLASYDGSQHRSDQNFFFLPPDFAAAKA